MPGAELLRGRAPAPSPPVELAAGPVTALLHEGDLRHVRIGEVELAQRIYVAVRDEAWNTIPGAIDGLRVESDGDRFSVVFECEHRHAEIDFAWRAEIRGAADGAISYRMRGEARSDFRFAKIGLNVHHPLRDCVGRPYVAQTTEGELRGRLPNDIAPQLLRDGSLTGMFAPYEALAISLEHGIEARFRFEGDLFELQDHRNWTDANFKSYCTPVSLPWPFDAHRGQRFEQAVELRVAGPAPRRVAPRERTAVRVGEQPLAPLPPIGLGLPESLEQPGPESLELLRRLAPAHVRADVAFADANRAQRFERALATARQLGAKLELGLFLKEGEEGRVGELASLLAPAAAEIARVLVFAGEMGFSSTSGTTTPAAVMNAVREQLGAALPGVEFVGGTNQFFTELNRLHPDPSAMDGLVYSINPQVHAADDWSLMENALAQAETVKMAATLAPGLPIFASPVTLIGRYGPFPAGPPEPDGPPANIDPRQGALFCAAWTVASVAQLAGAGVAAITCFETLGPSGVLPGSERGGEAFPVYHVLADLAELGPARLLAAEAEDQDAIAVLALRAETSEVLLIANLASTSRKVSVSASARIERARLLGIETAAQAVSRPLRFRAQAAACGGQTNWELGPYEVLRLTIDQERAGSSAG
ncbi:MAG: hypothetical protein ACYCU0_04110 [Solirubrobacteraceae bacterium]